MNYRQQKDMRHGTHHLTYRLVPGKITSLARRPTVPNCFAPAARLDRARGMTDGTAGREWLFTRNIHRGSKAILPGCTSLSRDNTIFSLDSSPTRAAEATDSMHKIDDKRVWVLDV